MLLELKKWWDMRCKRLKKVRSQKSKSLQEQWLLWKVKYFNALLQVSREEFRHVVIFTVEKRATFEEGKKSQLSS